MIKKDIAKRIYEAHGGMTLDEATSHTNALIEILTAAIVKNKSVTIKGFGKFRHKKKVVREVTLPNGEHQQSSAGEKIQFLPSPAFKNYLNTKK